MMRKIQHHLREIVVLVLTFCSIISCTDTEDLSMLDETIFVRHKNADMPAYIIGNGTEKVFLVTLNGGPGGLGQEFRGTAVSAIEDDYAVVYFDQRGSGMAQGNYGEDQLTLDIMAEDVLALAAVLKRKFGSDSRLFLLGHSWGGTLGTAALLKDQKDFLGWINVDGAHNPVGLYDQYQETFTITANTQIALGNSITFWESVLQRVSEVDPNSNLEDFLELNSLAFDAESTLLDDGIINDSEIGSDGDSVIFQYNILTFFWNLGQISSILVEGQELFQNVNLTPRLQEITIPSMFISGENDMIVPAVFAQSGFDNIGSEIKEVHIFENSGHAPLITEPERFKEELLRFINENK